jgi:hypothetical protein
MISLDLISQERLPKVSPGTQGFSWEWEARQRTSMIGDTSAILKCFVLSG